MRTRGGLSDVPETLAPLRSFGGPAALLAALLPVNGAGHTTNISVVDADGNACVLTSSLGLGSGDWLPGLDLHLNSMLGETDLIRGPLEPGARMGSMMAPTIVLGDSGCELAIGAAGGTRLRTALVGVLGSVLYEGVEPQAAVDRPRFHPAGDIVNAEPGVDEAWLASLERAGQHCAALARACTTTSAASVRPGFLGLRQIHGGAARCDRRDRSGDPAEVAAARTAGLVHCPAPGRPRVCVPALEAADPFDFDDVRRFVHRV